MFKLIHSAFSAKITPAVVNEDGKTRLVVNQSGELDVLVPGEFHYGAKLTIRTTSTGSGVDDNGAIGPTPHSGNATSEGTTPLHGSHISGSSATITSSTHSPPITLPLVIRDPHGAVVANGTQITLADLAKFRDLRGSLPKWKYSVNWTSSDYEAASKPTVVQDPTASGMSAEIAETVPFSSPGPLVDNEPFEKQLFQFDLYRVGALVVTVPNFKGTVQLIDPDGMVQRSSTLGVLTSMQVPITLRHLAKSRTANGAVRKWSVKVEGSQVRADHAHPTVTATVMSEGRLAKSALLERVQWLLGPNGGNFDIKGVNTEGLVDVNLTLHDPAIAETLDMLGLFDARAVAGGGEPVIINRPLTLFYTADTQEVINQHTVSLDASQVKVTSITADIAMSTNLPGAAVIKLGIVAPGRIHINYKSSLGTTQVATAGLTDGRLDVEIGVQVDLLGIPRMVTWCRSLPFDVQVSPTVDEALKVIGKNLADDLNKQVADKLASFSADPNKGPSNFMMMFGGNFTYQPIRFDGDDIVFEHVAPLEPEPHPHSGYATALGDRGDTWAVPKLKANIDHIVVVMMENRSYDHVLGSRALEHSDSKDGWTPALLAAVGDVRPLAQAGFDANSQKHKTRIPVPVGHALADVQEQLGKQKQGPQGPINDPAGFVSNFEKKIRADFTNPDTKTVATDVLGYYDDNDLPMYAFLANNYAYTDKYFSSHAGPTMPNRMFSLTGGVQRDRYGTPILDNNSGDNFLLSRATTIYDVLQREGVSFRVYESFPSVTMLRMFARYATDETNIKKFSDFAADMKAKPSEIPSVIVVEPAMHHAPENDDHPVADMYRGQTFIRQVYAQLVANPELWAKTLLIITYDEHGGLYDHVVPPLAETLHPDGHIVVHPGNTSVTSVAKTATTATTATTTPAAGSHATVHAGGVAKTAPTAGTHANIPPGTREMDGTPSLPIPYGVRVPTFVVSPMVPANANPPITLDHCSILKTILARFCGDSRPFLSDRVAAANTFEDFVTATSPRPVIPGPVFQNLPDNELPSNPPPKARSKIVTPILTREQMKAQATDYHDLSGRLARLLGR